MNSDTNDNEVLLVVQKRSIVMGTCVGFVIESLSLAWYAALVQERRDPEVTRPFSSAPTIVAVLLWTLITSTAPFLALANLVQFVRGHHYRHLSDTNPSSVTMVMVQRSVELWFSLGTIVGVSWASITVDSLLGFKNCVWFSWFIAAFTASYCLLLSRLYRYWLWQCPVIRHTPNRTGKSYDAVDPEQMDTVELSPGSLTL